MNPRNPNNSVFRHLDWITVALYVIMVLAGVFSIYAASYDFDHASLFNGEEFSGKQIRWIGLAIMLAVVLLLFDYRVYET